MINKIKKYPFSLLIFAIILYLSFFKPPKTSLEMIPYLDKFIHISMYLGLSGVIWLEYLKSHRNLFKAKGIILGAMVFPVLVSGCIELIQEYCTTYRGGDWCDFMANSFGVLLASAIAYYIIKPKFFS